MAANAMCPSAEAHDWVGSWGQPAQSWAELLAPLQTWMTAKMLCITDTMLSIKYWTPASLTLQASIALRALLPSRIFRCACCELLTPRHHYPVWGDQLATLLPTACRLVQACAMHLKPPATLSPSSLRPAAAAAKQIAAAPALPPLEPPQWIHQPPPSLLPLVAPSPAPQAAHLFCPATLDRCVSLAVCMPCDAQHCCLVSLLCVCPLSW